MLREGYAYLLITPWISLSAGGAIFVAVLGFYLAGEAPAGFFTASLFKGRAGSG